MTEMYRINGRQRGYALSRLAQLEHIMYDSCDQVRAHALFDMERCALWHQKMLMAYEEVCKLRTLLGLEPIICPSTAPKRNWLQRLWDLLRKGNNDMKWTATLFKIVTWPIIGSSDPEEFRCDRLLCEAESLEKLVEDLKKVTSSHSLVPMPYPELETEGRLAARRDGTRWLLEVQLAGKPLSTDQALSLLGQWRTI